MYFRHGLMNPVTETIKNNTYWHERDTGNDDLCACRVKVMQPYVIVLQSSMLNMLYII
jgi:hypothetical protein